VKDSGTYAIEVPGTLTSPLRSENHCFERLSRALMHPLASAGHLSAPNYATPVNDWR